MAFFSVRIIRDDGEERIPFTSLGKLRRFLANKLVELRREGFVITRWPQKSNVFRKMPREHFMLSHKDRVELGRITTLCLSKV